MWINFSKDICVLIGQSPLKKTERKEVTALLKTLHLDGQRKIETMKIYYTNNKDL